MKKLLVLAIALMVISAPAFAVNVLNGGAAPTTADWTVWTQRGDNVALNNGVFSGINLNGGIYQTFQVVAGATYSISGNFAWNQNGNGWMEVLIINGAGGIPTDGVDFNPGPGVNGNNIGCAKWDTWPADISSGEFSQMPVWDVTSSFVANSNVATLVLKAGNSGNGMAGAFTWSNVVIDGPAVPEPGSIVALMSGLVGLGGMVIRRKR